MPPTTKKNMLLLPSQKDTVVDVDNTEWRPVSFKNLLLELDHIQTKIGEVLLFRGHKDVSWLLDSTFSRNLKPKEGLKKTERYPETIWTDISRQHKLASTWLDKIDRIKFNPDVEKAGLCPYFEFHKHHQQNPGDERINDFEPLGTNFLDFSFNSKVGLHFANEGRDNKEGALFVVRQSAVGGITRTPQEWKSILSRLRSCLGKSPSEMYCWDPILVYPTIQGNNELDPKPKHQEAVYIAQMDFRFDLGMCWDIAREKKGVQAYVKMILPSGTQQEVQDYLKSFGIDRDYLFPQTVFDEASA